MSEGGGHISIEEASREVALACRRLGLLHLAFAGVLVRELGEEKGKKVLARAIKEYAKMIGEKKKNEAEERNLELTPESFSKVSDLPRIGMHEAVEEVEVAGEKRIRAYGCRMGKLWHEVGKDDLGRIYCHVDPASSMAFNPSFKLVHTKAIPDGDPFCELVMRPTTEKDRLEFQSKDTDWEAIECQRAPK